MADTAMCWAASASNVISWWQNLNSSSITSTVPQNEKIFDTFRGIYTNGVNYENFTFFIFIIDLRDTTFSLRKVHLRYKIAQKMD